MKLFSATVHPHIRAPPSNQYKGIHIFQQLGVPLCITVVSPRVTGMPADGRHETVYGHLPCGYCTASIK